jgi:hypothetical protein
MKLNTISRAVLASTLALSASVSMAASQPFDATSASVAINGEVLTTLGISVLTLGGATFDGSTLFLPVSDVSTLVDGGPARIDFGDADGFTLKTSLGSVSFKDFSFDYATNTLSGDLNGLGIISGINLQDSGLIVATTAEGNLGFDDLSAVSTQAGSRPLYLSASNFVIAPDLANYLTLIELPATSFPVAQAITSLTIGTAPIPEPSTYAMAGVGLLLVGAIARRRRAI